MKILAEYYITLLRKWQRWLVVGERAGKVQHPGDPRSQRRASGRAPRRGCTHCPHSSSFKGNTSPALRRRRTLFPEVKGHALRAHSKAKEGRCGRGAGGPGRGGLTFLRGMKAAASGTWGGSDSAYRDLLDYASQRSRREQGHSLKLL